MSVRAYVIAYELSSVHLCVRAYASAFAYVLTYAQYAHARGLSVCTYALRPPPARPARAPLHLIAPRESRAHAITGGSRLMSKCLHARKNASSVRPGEWARVTAIRTLTRAYVCTFA